MTGEWTHARGKLVEELAAYVLESNGTVLASRLPEVELTTARGTVTLLPTKDTFVASRALYIGPFEDSYDTPYAFDQLVEMEGKEAALALAPTGTMVVLRTIRIPAGTEVDAWGVVVDRELGGGYRDSAERTTTLEARAIHPTPTAVSWTRGLVWPKPFWLGMWALSLLVLVGTPLALAASLWMTLFVLLHALLRGYEPSGLRNPLWDLLVAIIWSPLVGYTVLSTRDQLSSPVLALVLLTPALLGVAVCVLRRRDDAILHRLAESDAESGILISGPEELEGFGNSAAFEAPSSSLRLVGRRSEELEQLESSPARFRAVQSGEKRVLYASWRDRDPLLEIRWALAARRILLVVSVLFAIGLVAIVLVGSRI